MHSAGRCAAVLMSIALLGCSPALNWRQASIAPAAHVQLLLPCKPDRAERPVEMAGSTLPLRMLGCDADGATFAISEVQVPDPKTAAIVMAGWRSAVLAHVKATDTQTMDWTPSGSNGGAALRLQAQGQRADGAGVALQAVWFMVARPQAMHVFHAVVFSPRLRPELGDAYFSGITVAP